MLRSIWKGAISFGLVHVPVALYPASTESGIDFDWLDKRSMDPVGYKRINKKTGKDIDKSNIVKGVKVDGEQYVVLSEAEIKAAYPKTTQTIEIESFVKAAEISFIQLDRPYYLEPIAKGEKVYALLREAMLASGVIGIARVVIHTKEYLAALIPEGQGLVMNTLRWAQEIRPTDELKLPAAGTSILKAAELSMAKELISSMTQTFKPEAYADRFSGAILELVNQRVKAGNTVTVELLEAPGSPSSDLADLSALLKQSLAKKGAAKDAVALQSTPSAPKKTAAKRASSKKA